MPSKRSRRCSPVSPCSARSRSAARRRRWKRWSPPHGRGPAARRRFLLSPTQTACGASAKLVASGELGYVRAIDLVFHNAYGPDKPWFYDAGAVGRRLRDGSRGCISSISALGCSTSPEVRSVTSHLSAGGEPVAEPWHRSRTSPWRRSSSPAARPVRLACSWRLHAGCDAEYPRAEVYGTKGGAVLRNVGGSFYDFAAERFTGTARREPCRDAARCMGARRACRSSGARRLANGARWTSAVRAPRRRRPRARPHLSPRG